MVRLSTILREPLIHFFVLGAGIFLLFGLIGGSEEDQTDTIIVKAGKIDRLLVLMSSAPLRLSGQ